MLVSMLMYVMVLFVFIGVLASGFIVFVDLFDLKVSPKISKIATMLIGISCVIAYSCFLLVSLLTSHVLTS